MFTLIKNAHIYAPADTGCQDLLLSGILPEIRAVNIHRENS